MYAEENQNMTQEKSGLFKNDRLLKNLNITHNSTTSKSDEELFWIGAAQKKAVQGFTPARLFEDSLVSSLWQSEKL